MQTSIKESDNQIAEILQLEETRQRQGLELIASENFVSPAVREVNGSVLTHKYAEGYPGKRYYGGCEQVDKAEILAIERAKALFRATYANVQPHSGSTANMAAYFALMQPGECLLGMDLAHGGHLTHGAAVSFSGKLYKTAFYGVDKDSELIDYDALRTTARSARPRVIVAGASSYSRIIDFEKIRSIADEVGALFVVDMAHIAGLVATDLHPSPIPHAHVVTATTHKTLRGPRGGLILMGKDIENDQDIRAPKSGRLKNVSELIDSAVIPGVQGGPMMHVIAAKAVAFLEASQPNYQRYQRQVVHNARVLSDTLQEEGARIVSGGTDNHIVLMDLTAFDITGKEAENVLYQAGITVNKNAIPFDTKSPLLCSGIRFGTPALTTRGMKESEMKDIGRLIIAIIKNRHDNKKLQGFAQTVCDLCQGFPLFTTEP